MKNIPEMIALMKPRLALSLLAWLILPNVTWAAFWVEDYTGTPEEYRLVRQGAELKISVQMLLKTDDQLSVLSETGKLQLIQDDNAREIVHSLTSDTGVFTVPESKRPPDIIDNLRALGEQWVTGIAEETVETRALISRGDQPVLISGASDLKNHLTSDFDTIGVYWTGGVPPYQVRLMDSSDNPIVTKTEIRKRHVTLTDLAIPTGNYGLEVLGESSSSYVSLVVVTPDDVPPDFQAVRESTVPDKVKKRYAIMVLSSDPQWRFQALQLADRNGFENLKAKIIRGQLPESVGN